MKKWQVGIDSIACSTGKVIMNILYLTVHCNLTSNLHNILKTPIIITLSLETTGPVGNRQICFQSATDLLANMQQICR